MPINTEQDFTVMKQADGRYRWVIFSSNAFQDRIGEIVSTKALEGDVDLTDKSGEYGPLRWWHCGEFEFTDAKDYTTYKSGPGVDIGDCDFRMVQGRMLIESGTFRSEAIAEAIAPVASKLQASIRFSHPRDQPDAEGVFTNIKSLERSLLPKGKACNRFTKLLVEKEKDMTTVKEKVQAFVALLKDPTLVESILAQAETVEKEAETQGVASKEAVSTETLPVDEKAKSTTPGDYLVVEKPGGDKADILHLQVSVDGKADHGLMGAAHAALMSPKGFRGQPYAGPDKDKAITKLKDMYKTENMDWPEDAPKAKEFSYADINSGLYEALTEAFPNENGTMGVSIEDFLPSGKVIYRDWSSGEVWMDAFTMDETGEVTLAGAPVAVSIHKVYIPETAETAAPSAPDLTPVITGMKELRDLFVAQVSVKDDTVVAVKEAQEGQLKRIQDLESLLTTTAKELAELKGGQPRGIKDLQSLRASQSEDNIREKSDVDGPKGDPSFLNFVTAGHNQ